MKKILFIATEPAVGMVPFATSIINALSEMEELDFYGVIIDSNHHSYRKVLSEKRISNITFLNRPRGLIQKTIHKIYPIKLIRTINNTITQKNIDAIHLLTGDYILAPYLKFKKISVPIFYVVHDLFPHEMKKTSLRGWINRKYTNWGYRAILEKADFLNTSSNEQVKGIQKMFPYKKVQYTHFPSLVTKTIADGCSVLPELVGVENYLLFFGNVNTYKGVDLLCNTFGNSNEMFEKYRLVIAGSGRNTGINEKNIIRINRFIEDEEIAELFKKAILVVYPYRSASMSGVLSLASYFGRPILVSDIPFFKEYDDGKSLIYFKSEDIADQKEKIMDLLNGNRTNTHSFYKRVYSSESLKKSYLNLYSQLLDK
jgi:glycosyltransferase involved in cell wall biosynthesis